MDNTKSIGTGTTPQGVTSTSQTAATAKSGGSGQLDKTDFLNILVQQLKNQDPLEPMKNEQFAVNLAQFSQLEQLININNSLTSGGASGGDVSSLAGYLGHEVLVQQDSIAVEGGSADTLSVNLPQDASGLVLELTKAGQEGPVERFTLPGAAAGSHTVSLRDLGVPDGEYSFAVKGVGLAGAEFSADALVVGTVSGFIPGPDAKLVVGDREVPPAAVRQVRLPTG